MENENFVYQEVRRFFNKSIGKWKSYRNYYRDDRKNTIDNMVLAFEVLKINDGSKDDLYNVKAGKNDHTFGLKINPNPVADSIFISRGNSVSNIDMFSTYATLLRDTFSKEGIRLVTDTPKGIFVEDIQFVDNDTRTRKSLILTNQDRKIIMLGLYLERRTEKKK